MAGTAQSLPLRIMTSVAKVLAKAYLKFKSPTLIAVGGSVGKTSTKLALAKVLSSEKRVSCMDDSYNFGLGLYLSVFERKIPTSLYSPVSWVRIIIGILVKFFQKSPEYIILEYGIDSPGDMDGFIQFAQPDISFLTAVTSEHMEFLKDIETVGKEEVKLLHGAKQFGIVNRDDVAEKFLTDVTQTLHTFGSSDAYDASYEVKKWTHKGAVVDFNLSGHRLADITVQYISEALIRQLCGVAYMAKLLGVSDESIVRSLAETTPALSRMRCHDGVNGSTIIDDTANFSPEAGIQALRSLKRLPAKRHIAVLGNMHELGEYETKGFGDVAKELDSLSMLVFVGPLAKQYFVPLAQEHGYTAEKNLFYFETALEAGAFLQDQLTSDDIVLVKGPFGGYYLEETVRLLLKNPEERVNLTRQSDFWVKKKRLHFGDAYDV